MRKGRTVGWKESRKKGYERKEDREGRKAGRTKGRSVG